MASYDAPTPSGDDSPDDLRIGAELIATNIDSEALVSYHLVWAAQEDLDAAIAVYMKAIGHAARVLGLDLAELVDLLGHRGGSTQILADQLALSALASEIGGGES